MKMLSWLLTIKNIKVNFGTSRLLLEADVKVKSCSQEEICYRRLLLGLNMQTFSPFSGFLLHLSYMIYSTHFGRTILFFT